MPRFAVGRLGAAPLPLADAADGRPRVGDPLPGDAGVAEAGEKRVYERMRKLMQLGRDDERQEEEDRNAHGQGVVGLYGTGPVVS